MKKIIYVNEVDITQDSGRGINEREFIKVLIQNDYVIKVIIPSYSKNFKSILSKFCHKEKIDNVFSPKIHKLINNFLFQLFLIIKLNYLIYFRYRKYSFILLLRPYLFTFYLLFLIKHKRKLTIAFRITDLIAENLKIVKKERYIYKFIIPISYILHRLILKKCDQIITVTSQIADFYKKIYKVKIPLKIIPNGVNTNTFYPIEDSFKKEILKTKLKIPNDYLIIGYIGNLRTYIALEEIIKSIKILIKERKKKVLFIVIGDGPKKKYLIDIVKKMSLDKYVRFLGKIPYKDLPPFINIFNIGIALFSEEKIKLTGTSSLKIFQYLSCGIPVLTNFCESHKFIETYKVGTLIKNLTPEKIANGIEEILNQKYNKENIRNIVLEHFDNQVIAEKYIEFLLNS